MAKVSRTLSLDKDIDDYLAKKEKETRYSKSSIVNNLINQEKRREENARKN